MEGIHFDSSTYYAISEFAHHLKWEIEHNKLKDAYDFAYNFSNKTIALLTTSQQIIETAGMLTKEIEGLYDGDYGEETFAELASEILGGVKT